MADDILDDIRITSSRRIDRILHEAKHGEWAVNAGP